MSAVRAAGFALATFLFALPLRASGSTPADRDAARALATRGFDLFQDGDYPHAIESFERAEAKIHAPPHLLYIARAQAKLGQLVAARATYERIVGEKLDSGASQPFKDAQASARTELGAVATLIPAIDLTLTGDDAERAAVLLDEKPFPPGDLGHDHPVDPGLHTVVVTVPGCAPVERTVTLRSDGATERLSIAVDPPNRSVGPIVALAVGGVALTAGGAALGLYLTRSPRDSTLGMLSIAGFAAGGVGVGTGVALLALRPSVTAPGKPAARLVVTLGARSVGLSGAF